MALNVAVGTLTQPGATGNQTVNLAANFDPKALIMWTSPLASDTTAGGDASFSMGFGTYRGSAVQQGYCTYFSDDTPTTSVVARGQNTTSILRLFSDGTTPTVDLEVDFVSFATGASSNFVINWVNLHTTASILVGYMVLGGAEITDAYVHSFAQAAGATQNVTVVAGFGQPDLMMWMSSGATALADTAASCALQFSAAISATERFSSTYNDEDNVGTMLGASWQTSKAFSILNPTTQAADAEADLSAKGSWPTDGYQFTYSDQAALTTQMIGLALKGTFTSKIGSVDTPTSAGNTDVDFSTTGSSPTGALFFASTGALAAATINSTATSLGAFQIGATDGTNESFAGAGNDDADTVADTGNTYSNTKAMGILETDGTASRLAAADGSFVGDTVRLAWTTVDSVAHRVGYVAVGNAPTSEDEKINRLGMKLHMPPMIPPSRDSY